MRFAYLYYTLLERGPEIAVVLLVIGTLGTGAAGWVYTHPPTTEITDQTGKQTVESSLQTQAVVSGETDLYEQGTTLRGQPAYLIDATPNVTLALETHLPANASGTIDQNLELVYTATHEGEVLWRRSTPLHGKTTRRGETVSTQTHVSIPTILARQSGYQQEFGEAAAVSVGIRVSVEYRTNQYEGTLSDVYAIESGSRWYSIPSETMSQTHSTPKTRTIELEITDKPRFYVPAILGIVCLAGGVLVGSTYRRSSRQLSSEDLETAVHQRRYEEWISHGTLPRATTELTVQLDSLEDLVDVAIDTHERVIHDTETNEYAVLHDSTRYSYEPTSEDSGE